ncbi:peptide/nickel transport system ATP-binding protein/oligopeptide transport system ATP-binding protein [Thalassobacillus cyri]|uniref:Peptide/nickel transport system ATP-binding protein/oligopeptide transport system ATP-binding protein n=1 Tax=Thalassobacillus cyri TaxID=571932 RepID=A0A1H4E1A3_9BACI|nr:ABC transporter ATP-binding protein [Thalassobacillus cyri]SEA78340.1 peptide/nickel transport system ATP-binding protein/oligopeptide transport system ATP-binding protein [Thalassobacillus cyri]
METLLNVNNLVTSFRTAKEKIQAVRGVSFSVDKGETLCIVGESGCGKSITTLSIMGLLPDNGEISEGSITFQGQELTKKKEEEMRRHRGNDISMIFQEPMTALNPVFTVGYQIMEPLNLHTNLGKNEKRKRAVELLNQVGLSNPEKTLKKYPHELSGGMRQRVMIAISLACNPSLLIADEPTTALDVTIQAQILDLIDDLKEKMGMGVLMVTHDMGVVAEVADRVMVMYAGNVVETGTVKEVFENPSHPYTKGLLASVPNVDEEDHSLEAIPGTLPNLNEKIAGCRFHPRCPYAMDKCRKEDPPHFRITDQQQSKCWLHEEVPSHESTHKAYS